jgi:hypothetical protein
MTEESVLVLRPSAVLPAWVASDVITALEKRDVSQGGVWSASVGLWQRYDRPWDGQHGARGTAVLVGTIGAVYGTPTRYDVTIYRVTLTEPGRAAGWTHASLTDDALQYGHVTLANCPRVPSLPPPEPLRLSSVPLAVHGV